MEMISKGLSFQIALHVKLSSVFLSILTAVLFFFFPFPAYEYYVLFFFPKSFCDCDYQCFRENSEICLLCLHTDTGPIQRNLRR